MKHLVTGVTIGVLAGITLSYALLAKAVTIEYIATEEPEIVLIEENIEWTEERIDNEIKTHAEKYGISYSFLKHTIACESMGSTTVQSRHIRPDGSREKSFGLAQFYIPAKNKTKDGTEITEEMAKDPRIAIETMAWYFSKGKSHLWTCARNVL